MAMFNSYVKLPEGRWKLEILWGPQMWKAVIIQCFGDGRDIQHPRHESDLPNSAGFWSFIKRKINPPHPATSLLYYIYIYVHIGVLSTPVSDPALGLKTLPIRSAVWDFNSTKSMMPAACLGSQGAPGSPVESRGISKKSYCGWKKSCTSWYMVYPIIYRVSTIQGGAGFLISNIWKMCKLVIYGGFTKRRCMSLPAVRRATQFHPADSLAAHPSRASQGLSRWPPRWRHLKC